MKLSKSVKPISYLKQNTAEAIREVHENNTSLIITQNGEAKVVIQDIAEYEEVQETLALLKLIAQSKEEYGRGQYQSVKKSFSSIRQRISDGKS